MNPKYANYPILANDFLEKNQLQRTKRVFEKSLNFVQTKKEEADNLFGLADLTLQLDDPARARDLFRQILSLENHPGAYYGLAISGENLGQDKDQIIQNYREAIRLDPSYTKAYFYLAHVYLDLKDYAKAQDLFPCCLDLEPEDFVCYNDLSSLYEEQKNYQEARTYSLKPLDLCPSYARALYNMGVVENRLGRPQEALAYYRQSLEKYSHPYTYLSMPVTYFVLREGQEAKKILLRGSTHHQDSVNLHYNLACAYVHLKDPAQALEELKKAMKISPHTQDWARTDIGLKELVKELQIITTKTLQQIEKMHQAGRLLASVHRELRKQIRPGVKTTELDEFVEDYLVQRGAYPKQKGYEGFPYSICASVDDETCHGFPSRRILENGDIITVDMVVWIGDWLADSARSCRVGEVSPEADSLLKVIKVYLYEGIKETQVGNRLRDIGHVIQSYAESRGYSMIREFIDHSIGQDMHEDPQVLHYGKAGRGLRIQEGTVFTIEPMINIGEPDLTMDDNGWTARTRDGSLSVQYEHTLTITKDGPIILTDQGDGDE